MEAFFFFIKVQKWNKEMHSIFLHLLYSYYRHSILFSIFFLLIKIILKNDERLFCWWIHVVSAILNLKNVWRTIFGRKERKFYDRGEKNAFDEKYVHMFYAWYLKPKH